MPSPILDEFVISEQDAARIDLTGEDLVCELEPATISFELRVRTSPLLLPGVAMWVDRDGRARFVSLRGHG
jgi:hypothetical protein